MGRFGNLVEEIDSLLSFLLVFVHDEGDEGLAEEGRVGGVEVEDLGFDVAGGEGVGLGGEFV